MAARDTGMGYPLDVPSIIGPGIKYDESRAPGDARHLAIGPENPIRRAKGDLGNLIMPGFESRALTGPGPVKNLRRR